MKSIFLFVSSFLLTTTAWAADPLRVVATLPSFADVAKAIGGEDVVVASIASPRFNPHFIEPRPSDVLKLKRADLYLHSGLDLEAWGGPLVDAAARPELRKGGERQLDLAQGISLLEIPSGSVSRAEGDIHLFGNPHYWMDPRNVKIMAAAIASKLSVLAPDHADAFAKRYRAFVTDIDRQMGAWKEKLAPFRGRKLVGYHNEWVYLMAFTELRMEQFLEPKPGIPPSPSQLSSIIDYVRRENVGAIVQPTYYSTDAANSVREKTGVPVLLLAQNVGEIPEATSYGAMIDYDISKIVESLSHE